MSFHSKSLSRSDRVGDRVLAGFRSECEALIHEPEAMGGRLLLFILAGILALSIGLSAIVRVDRVVSSPGQIVATEPTVVVQAMNRAVITAVKVREGDRVKQGDVLATLDATFAEADVAQVEGQIESLDAEIARLEAERDGQTLDSLALPERYTGLQRSLMAQRKAQYDQQMRGFDAKIAQAEAAVARYRASRARYAERLKVVGEIEGMRQKLADQQVGSRLSVLQANDQRLDIARAMEQETNAMNEASSQLEAARAERETFARQWRAQVEGELVQKRTARDAADAQLSKANRNQDLITLRAPVDAIVLQSAKLSVGSILREATPMFTLVPAGSALEVEVQIDARDMSFVRVGDPVSVKVEAYNYLEHGNAEGRIRAISEDALAVGEGAAARPFYRAYITLDASTMYNVPVGFRPTPGMPVTGDVKVGDRTLLSYLARGAFRTVDEALREP